MFNWENILTVIIGVVAYIIGMNFLGRGFSLIGLSIFIIVMFILNPILNKITDI